MNKASKIVCVGLAVLLVASVIFGWNQYEKRDFLQKNIDRDFQTNFSLLCATLSQSGENGEDWHAEIKMYAHTMNTVFAETSYAGYPFLSEVVQAVCSHAELGNLWNIMDAELAQALSRLSHDLTNETLAKTISETHFKN